MTLRIISARTSICETLWHMFTSIFSIRCFCCVVWWPRKNLVETQCKNCVHYNVEGIVYSRVGYIFVWYSWCLLVVSVVICVCVRLCKDSPVPILARARVLCPLTALGLLGVIHNSSVPLGTSFVYKCSVSVCCVVTGVGHRTKVSLLHTYHVQLCCCTTCFLSFWLM